MRLRRERLRHARARRPRSVSSGGRQLFWHIPTLAMLIQATKSVYTEDWGQMIVSISIPRYWMVAFACLLMIVIVAMEYIRILQTSYYYSSKSVLYACATKCLYTVYTLHGR